MYCAKRQFPRCVYMHVLGTGVCVFVCVYVGVFLCLSVGSGGSSPECVCLSVTLGGSSFMCVSVCLPISGSGILESRVTQRGQVHPLGLA